MLDTPSRDILWLWIYRWSTRNQELDDDTRRIDNDLDMFGPPDRRNTLRPVSLLYCIEYEMYVDVD